MMFYLYRKIISKIPSNTFSVPINYFILFSIKIYKFRKRYIYIYEFITEEFFEKKQFFTFTTITILNFTKNLFKYLIALASFFRIITN